MDGFEGFFSVFWLPFQCKPNCPRACLPRLRPTQMVFPCLRLGAARVWDSFQRTRQIACKNAAVRNAVLARYAFPTLKNIPNPNPNPNLSLSADVGCLRARSTIKAAKILRWFNVFQSQSTIWHFVVVSLLLSSGQRRKNYRPALW